MTDRNDYSPRFQREMSMTASNLASIARLIGTASFVAMTLLAYPGPALSASLNDFLRQLDAHHPRLNAAAENTNASEFNTDAARGAWLPQLSANTQAGTTRSALNSGSNDGVRPGLNASQLLFDGGKAEGNIKARDQETRANAAQQEELKLNLTARTVDTYLEWYRQNQLLRLGDEQLKALSKFEQMVGDIASFDKGRTSDLTLVRTRISQVANARDARALSQRDSALQLRQICVCGLSPSEAPPPFSPFLPAREPENLQDEWLAKHPTVLATLARRNGAEADAETAAAWWKPSVQFQVISQTEQDYNGKTRYFGLNTVGLNVQASIFDGNTSNAREKSAQARLRSADATLRATLVEMEADARRLWSLVEQRQQRIQMLNRLVAESDKAFDVVLEQFKLGRRNVIELLSYENERWAARSQVISEEVDLELTRARWLAAVGNLTQKLGPGN